MFDLKKLNECMIFLLYVFDLKKLDDHMNILLLYVLIWRNWIIIWTLCSYMYDLKKLNDRTIEFVYIDEGVHKTTLYIVLATVSF